MSRGNRQTVIRYEPPRTRLCLRVQPVEKGKGKVNGEAKTLEGGLKIQDHKVGSGPAAKSGNLVKVRYVGKLQNGKIFDSNTKGEPVSHNFSHPIIR